MFGLRKRTGRNILLPQIADFCPALAARGAKIKAVDTESRITRVTCGIFDTSGNEASSDDARRQTSDDLLPQIELDNAHVQFSIRLLTSINQRETTL